MNDSSHTFAPLPLAAKVGRALLAVFFGLPLFVFVTPFLLLILLCWMIISTPAALIRSCRYRRRIRTHFGAAGRLLDKAELRRRIDRGEGTLIIDGACKHEMNRVLWTPDRLFKLGPSPATARGPGHSQWATNEFLMWCRPRYADPLTGSAVVVITSPGPLIRRLSRAPTGTDFVLLSDAITGLPLTTCDDCWSEFVPTAGHCPGCGRELAA